MASVVVDTLKCGVNYMITVGGTLGGELLGPSVYYKDFNEQCPPVMATTSVTPTCEKSCLTCWSTYHSTHIYIVAWLSAKPVNDTLPSGCYYWDTSNMPFNLYIYIYIYIFSFQMAYNYDSTIHWMHQLYSRVLCHIL